MKTVIMGIYPIYHPGRPSLSVQMERYKCPYCDRQSASPGGVRFHVKLEHPDKLDEFNQMHYPEMAERFKKSISSE
jgi:hypothetical protein